MKMNLFYLGLLFLAHLCTAMQPQIPTIQNKTVIIPANANASVVSTPTWIKPGPVIGGVPPYSYSLHQSAAANTVNYFNGVFIITPSQLPFSFDYVAIDSLGQQSQPATITVEGGSNKQEGTHDLTGTEPG